MLPQEVEIEKCETDPLGVFSAKIFEYWGQKGDPKSKFWGQNQKILNNRGPKQLIMIFPTHFKYSRGLPTPFLINFRVKPQKYRKIGVKHTPTIASSVAL